MDISTTAESPEGAGECDSGCCSVLGKVSGSSCVFMAVVLIDVRTELSGSLFFFPFCLTMRHNRQHAMLTVINRKSPVAVAMAMIFSANNSVELLLHSIGGILEQILGELSLNMVFVLKVPVERVKEYAVGHHSD